MLLEKRLQDLEVAPDRPGVDNSAKQLAVKLEVLDADFKSLHLQLVDLLDEEWCVSRTPWISTMTMSQLSQSACNSSSSNPVALQSPLTVARRTQSQNY